VDAASPSEAILFFAAGWLFWEVFLLQLQIENFHLRRLIVPIAL
jgi:hypothetical protein